MLNQGIDHLCGRTSKYWAGNKLNCGKNPNIDAIFSEKDVGKDDSDNTPDHHGPKPGSFK
jgi:hypothetical protein